LPLWWKQPAILVIIDLPIRAERFPVEVVAVRAIEEQAAVAYLDTAGRPEQPIDVPGGPTLTVRPISRAADGGLIHGDGIEVFLASPGEEVGVGDQIVFGALTATLAADRDGMYRVRLTATEVADAGEILAEFRSSRRLGPR
jgi:hypothetical protein